VLRFGMGCCMIVVVDDEVLLVLSRSAQALSQTTMPSCYMLQWLLILSPYDHAWSIDATTASLSLRVPLLFTFVY